MRCDIKPSTVGVVISTYNNPKWLEKTLWGYLCQDRQPDEIIIADDGSGDETRRLVEQFALFSSMPIKHVWHEDNGFLKNVILNKAIVAATADYLIFTDQDCVPRRDFVSTHIRMSGVGRFVSGGYFKLPMAISAAITKDDIESGRAFSLRWLSDRGLGRGFRRTKLMNSRIYAACMNFLTPARASWNGCNSSAWREELLAVNGYNETMRYGGEDRELGERLVNRGLKPRQARYSVICIHLDHGRPYRDEQLIEENRKIRRQTRKARLTVTPDGIEKKL